MRIVQKFGGTSMSGVARIKETARIVRDEYHRGHQIAVVVSAMSGETNRLLTLAQDISDCPCEREVDALLATGEQASATLLAMELDHLGIDAFSLNGAQLGMRTSGAFGRAKIDHVDANHLIAAMDAGRIAVITGFQGVDIDGNITTLGRGGSDTSAVAIAIAVRADVCDIYTDVDGIYTTDPRIVPNAHKIKQISYEEMLEFASLGAKVLQTRSVGLAMKYGMPIHLRSSFNNITGSMVCREDTSMEKASVTGVAYNRNEAKVTLQGIPDQPGIAAGIFNPIAKADINVDVIVQNISAHGMTDITFTVEREDYRKTMEIMHQHCADLKASHVAGSDDVAKVSIIGVGMKSHAGVAQTMFQILADAGVNIEMITTSEIKVTVVLGEADVDRAVRLLHTAFDLDEGDNA
ncbi:MAG: aspartate kinase [Mariprofundaceae bacterium]|nr:aspartate kinase [Mariprofundaceae bacterium]